LPTQKHERELADLEEDFGFVSSQREEGTLQEQQSDNCVLLVDDCAFNLAAVECLLEQFNMKSDLCEDGN